jgi:hypothetical protein
MSLEFSYISTPCIFHLRASNITRPLSERFTLLLPSALYAIYLVFRAQADWTLTHTCHKDMEQHNGSFYNTRWRNTDWLTDQVITKWLTLSLAGDTTVSADKMFWTSNKRAQWTHYSLFHLLFWGLTWALHLFHFRICFSPLSSNILSKWFILFCMYSSFFILPWLYS